jgi:hypothetical protein
MGSAVGADPDFVVGNRDIGQHVDQVPEDLARLSIVIASHTASHDAIEGAGENQKISSASSALPPARRRADSRQADLGWNPGLRFAERLGSRQMTHFALLGEDESTRRAGHHGKSRAGGNV